MAENTAIEWCDHTFNTHWGCSAVSPGCKNCYAEKLAKRFGFGWGDDAPKREFAESHWEDLEVWNRKAAAEGVRRRVFTNSMSDLFDKFAPAGVRERHFGYVERTPNLDHLLLTKRIGNVARMVPARWLEPGGWPANAWLGITVVTQEEADRDIPKLLDVPAHVRFLSIEPMLGPIDLTRYHDWLGRSEGGMWCPDCPERGVGIDPAEHRHCLGEVEDVAPYEGIDWVICGGESGPHARPMHPDWARSLRDQCAAAGVPFLFKQWGEWSHRALVEDTRGDLPASLLYVPEHDATYAKVGKKGAGRLLDGVEHNGFPEVRP